MLGGDFPTAEAGHKAALRCWPTSAAVHMHHCNPAYVAHALTLACVQVREKAIEHHFVRISGRHTLLISPTQEDNPFNRPPRGKRSGSQLPDPSTARAKALRAIALTQPHQ